MMAETGFNHLAVAEAQDELVCYCFGHTREDRLNQSRQTAIVPGKYPRALDVARCSPGGERN